MMKSKRGVMYPYAVLLVTLFAMAFFWFVFYMVVDAVRTPILAQMEDLASNSTSTIFEYADTFTFNIILFFLALMVIGLLYWAVVYAQRKGREVLYY